ncbi:MAG: transketolase [Pseudomonadota bacterium]|jgi:transketolase
MAEVGHTEMANAIRALAMDAVEAAKSGHPGMPMGMADAATVLFRDVLRYDAGDPNWANRDRFVLSAGHGSMLLYSLLYLTGYPGFSIDDIKSFRQLGAKTAGHPEHGHAPGIETTTGPLGQGIANAVGMALGERIWNARLGGVIDYRTYVIAGDGCLMEGISQEAISLAGHLGLGKLIVLFDDNGISIDGPTSLATSENHIARFAASGWNTASVDGHDPAAVKRALDTAKADASKPWLIACKTVIGFGAPNKQGSAATHGAPLGGDEIKAAREKLGWPHAPFVVPDAILQAWRGAGRRGHGERESWRQQWAGVSEVQRAQFEDPLNASVKAAMEAAVADSKAAVVSDGGQKATRVWSELALGHLTAAVPGMIGGSADLTGSNNTKVKAQEAISKDHFGGSYIYYGVREHGMAAVMNGLALTGGLIPYGGTFLVFTDYCRPSIRLSALMQKRVIYVMTHDSIGLGEDGPTHQPVEHLAALRAIPNLQVFRPADGIETVECWQLALSSPETPSVLALTRQGVPNLRQADRENLSARGGYVLLDAEGGRDVTLLATGSEVGLAVAARDALAGEGVKAAVVSMPSFELFRAQSKSYRDEVLGRGPRVAVEAGIAQGWHEWLGERGRFIGMASFGASAPAPQLYEHFGITAEAVAAAARELIA